MFLEGKKKTSRNAFNSKEFIMFVNPIFLTPPQSPLTLTLTLPSLSPHTHAHTSPKPLLHPLLHLFTASSSSSSSFSPHFPSFPSFPQMKISLWTSSFGPARKSSFERRKKFQKHTHTHTHTHANSNRR